ncbi:UDP-glycosyltransferase 83A1 [Linum grandiflorum]
MAKQPHVVVVPLPAQGHLLPLMKLAYKLANRGIHVTVMNLEAIHHMILHAMREDDVVVGDDRVRLVGVRDGLLLDHRHDVVKQMECLERVMPGELRSRLKEKEVVCVIADVSLAWAFREARAMGIKTAAFSPASAANLALLLHIPSLLQLGILDHHGVELTGSPIGIGKEIPSWEANEVPWSHPVFPDELRKLSFQSCCSNVAECSQNFDYILVNSSQEIEPSACQLIPNVFPIGPLQITGIDPDDDFLVGSLWPEDQTCIAWLNKQAQGTVIYVAFGSIATIQNQRQFHELALGLELTGNPFLWVVRPGASEFPDGFLKRVGDRGKIVEWANQEKVLSHSSIACFLSHCGWNSTLDGLVAGVPFLCWPFCFDQFHNKKYICETWRIGLELKPNNVENETSDVVLITKIEIARKVDELISNETIKSNSMKLREMARDSNTDAGSSFLKFESFVRNLCSSCL